MRWLDCQIGDVVPSENRRGILGAEMDAPAWFVFRTPPQREAAAIAWLKIREVDAWRPTEVRKRRVPRGLIREVEYEASIMPRYVLARFDRQPQWDVLRQSAYLTGVICVNSQPIRISDGVLSDMAGAPQRLADIRRRRQEAAMIHAGDRVRIEDGWMRGWIVDISEVNNGIASFIVPLLGKENTAHMSVEQMTKLQGVA